MPHTWGGGGPQWPERGQFLEVGGKRGLEPDSGGLGKEWFWLCFVKMKEITESRDVNRNDPVSRRILFMHKKEQNVRAGMLDGLS